MPEQSNIPTPKKEKSCAIVGCVSTPRGLSLLAKPPREIDFIELRLDMLLAAGAKHEEIARKLSKRKKPVFLTPRIPAEGGAYKWKAKERESLLDELLPWADGFDIELRTIEAMKKFLEIGREHKMIGILSAHSPKKTLDDHDMLGIVQKFVSIGGSMLKVAALAKSHRDIAVMVSALSFSRGIPIAMMATGPLAGVSRIVLPLMGSKLVYGYLDEPTAPGQPEARYLAKKLAACLA